MFPSGSRILSAKSVNIPGKLQAVSHLYVTSQKELQHQHPSPSLTWRASGRIAPRGFHSPQKTLWIAWLREVVQSDSLCTLDHWFCPFCLVIAKLTLPKELYTGQYQMLFLWEAKCVCGRKIRMQIYILSTLLLLKLRCCKQSNNQIKKCIK